MSVEYILKKCNLFDTTIITPNSTDAKNNQQHAFCLQLLQ